MTKTQKVNKKILGKIYMIWMMHTIIIYIIYQIILHVLAKENNPWPYTIFISISPLIISITVIYVISKYIPLKLISNKYKYHFCILGAIIFCLYKASLFFKQYMYDWIYDFIAISIIYFFLLYCYQKVASKNTI